MKPIQKIRKDLKAFAIKKDTLVKVKGGTATTIVNPDDFDI